MADEAGVPRLRDEELQKYYLAALRETDPEKLQKRVSDFETAIFNRLQSIANDKKHDELQILHEAVHALRSLQTDRLNYPRWKSK